MMSALKLLTASCLLALARGLDVELVDVTCDESLPVTADFDMTCRRGQRCTFGQMVNLTGSMVYNGVANTGIQNDLVYATSKLSLFALDFTLFDFMELPLCLSDYSNSNSSYIVGDSSNANDCPGDGTYNFKIPYRLPSSGADSASWLASGWEGSGFIAYYAEPDSAMMIGYCELDLKTYVTHDSATDGLVAAPSAAVTAGIVLGSLVAALLACCLCYSCQKKRQTKRIDKVQPGDDVTSEFRRMYEDDSVLPSTIGSGSRASKSMM